MSIMRSRARVLFVAVAVTTATTASLLSSTALAPATPTTSAARQARAAAGGEDTSARAFLVDYRLAPGVVANTANPANPNPSQVHGVLGMPRGRGARPVVVVLHGNHPLCVHAGKSPELGPARVTNRWSLVCADPKNLRKTPGIGPDYLRNDAGLSYLVQGLTRQGFVAVAIDVAAAEMGWGGETNPQKGYAQLIDAHLRFLADLNKGRTHGLRIRDTRGRIATSVVGLVGHSRGGGYVLSPPAARRPGLFGVVALEPQTTGEPAPHKVPVLNIRGACDEDTGSDAGRDTVKALAASRRTQVAADVLLAGTGHRMLNTNFADPRGKGPLGDCPANKIAAPSVARDQVAQLTAAFLAQALNEERTYRLPAFTALHPRGGNLRTGGPRLRFVPARPQGYVGADRLPRTASPQRILPAIPRNLRVDKEPGSDL
ncbi:alpha/beta hydrolase [Streptomyces sp. NPDC001941]|uniref:alpha/beta hydrolase n=1 Tax=Streptomyces sp. NPDC001941 TaxID=3154659 RepID=UPI00331D809C